MTGQPPWDRKGVTAGGNGRKEVGCVVGYPSVTCAMVHAVWRDVFQFGAPIADLLTRLTTHGGHLPQGAPTSGYLANIALLPAAEAIKQLCADAECTVTFYVDDISISGLRAREVIEPLIAILHAHGLSVGRGKTKVMPPSRAQMSTGYGINAGRPSVPRNKRDAVRELIHELRIRRKLGHDFTKLLRSIDGRIAHVARTNPGNAERLTRLLEHEVGERQRKGRPQSGRKRTCPSHSPSRLHSARRIKSSITCPSGATDLTSKTPGIG